MLKDVIKDRLDKEDIRYIEGKAGDINFAEDGLIYIPKKKLAVRLDRETSVLQDFMEMQDWKFIRVLDEGEIDKMFEELTSRLNYV